MINNQLPPIGTDTNRNVSSENTAPLNTSEPLRPLPTDIQQLLRKILQLILTSLNGGQKGKSEPETQKPFFEQFLSNQDQDQNQVQVTVCPEHTQTKPETGTTETRKFPNDADNGDLGGGTTETRKFPNDADNGDLGGGTTETRKFPNDADNGDLGGGTTETRKFPNDADGGDLGGGGIQTLKFPNDIDNGGIAG